MTLCAFLQRGKFRPRLQQLVASNSEETVEKCSRKAFSLLPNVQAAIAELSSLKGVGPATASGLHSIGIQTNGSELKKSYGYCDPLKVQTDCLLTKCTDWAAGTHCSLFSFNSLHAYLQIGLGLTVNFVPAVLAAGAPEQTAFMSDEAMESIPGLKPIQYTAKHYALYLGKMVERTDKLNKGEIIIGMVVTSALVNFWFDALEMHPYSTLSIYWKISCFIVKRVKGNLMWLFTLINRKRPINMFITLQKPVFTFSDVQCKKKIPSPPQWIQSRIGRPTGWSCVCGRWPQSNGSSSHF